MLAPTPSLGQVARIGVGIDTSRYGHYAAFLRDDLQPAAAELQFAESATGYAALRQRLQRLDAAGDNADNLLHFLHALSKRRRKRRRSSRASVMSRSNALSRTDTSTNVDRFARANRVNGRGARRGHSVEGSVTMGSESPRRKVPGTACVIFDQRLFARPAPATTRQPA